MFLIISLCNTSSSSALFSGTHLHSKASIESLHVSVKVPSFHFKEDIMLGSTTLSLINIYMANYKGLYLSLSLQNYAISHILPFLLPMYIYFVFVYNYLLLYLRNLA